MWTANLCVSFSEKNFGTENQGTKFRLWLSTGKSLSCKASVYSFVKEAD